MARMSAEEHMRLRELKRLERDRRLEEAKEQFAENLANHQASQREREGAARRDVRYVGPFVQVGSEWVNPRYVSRISDESKRPVEPSKDEWHNGPTIRPGSPGATITRITFDHGESFTTDLSAELVVELLGGEPK